MTSVRGFLAVSAALLVLAVALGTLLPIDEPLSQVMADLDPSLLTRVQGFELRYFGAWLWQGVTVPLMLRPAWLVPFGLGLVAGGCALSLAWRVPNVVGRR